MILLLWFCDSVQVLAIIYMMFFMDEEPTTLKNIVFLLSGIIFGSYVMWRVIGWKKKIRFGKRG